MSNYQKKTDSEQSQQKFVYRTFDTSNSILLNLTVQEKGLPMGVWFTKGYSEKTKGHYIRIQLTNIEPDTDGNSGYETKRTWLDPPTFCSLKAFESFLGALRKMMRA